MAGARNACRSISSVRKFIQNAFLPAAPKPTAAPVRLLSRLDEAEERPKARVHQSVGENAFGARHPLHIRQSTIMVPDSKTGSSHSVGRGVFAGCAIGAREVVEVCPVLGLQRDGIALESAGMKYFFQSPEGELLCVLGYGMLYNHGGPAANLSYQLQTPPLRDTCDGGVCVVFVTRRAIKEGEELLIDYSDAWWNNRGIAPTKHQQSNNHQSVM